jgi:hypothetical protein
LRNELRGLIGVASRLDASDAGNRNDDRSAGDNSNQATVDTMATLLLFLCALGLEVVTLDFDCVHHRCAPV